MTRYLCTALLVACLGACSHGSQPSKTSADNRKQSDVYGSRESHVTEEESRAGVTPPQHRTRDEMATTGDVPDTTRRANPATEPLPNTMQPAAPGRADDTGVNERDRNDQTLTPMDQSENEDDMRLTQEIRRAIVDNSALSFSSKNVKIITRDGKVTLRGTVPSKQERSLIVDAAKAQAGVRHVDDQLEISTK